MSTQSKKEWVLTARTESGSEMRWGNLTYTTAKRMSSFLIDEQRPETPDRITRVTVTQWDFYSSTKLG